MRHSVSGKKKKNFFSFGVTGFRWRFRISREGLLWAHGAGAIVMTTPAAFSPRSRRSAGGAGSESRLAAIRHPGPDRQPELHQILLCLALAPLQAPPGDRAGVVRARINPRVGRRPRQMGGAAPSSAHRA